jgi:hypothetical protein
VTDVFGIVHWGVAMAERIRRTRPAGRPVVGLPPDQEAAGRLLEAVAVLGIVVLVFETVADDPGNLVVKSLEPERERAGRLSGTRGRSKKEYGQKKGEQ